MPNLYGRQIRHLSWQGKKASNPRPTVLETAALPAELFPCIQFKIWWTVRDSNPGPTGYEPAALPTELTVQAQILELPPRYRGGNTVLGAPCRIRTYDPAVNSRMLYLLS